MDVREGFRVGDRLFAWGSLIDDVAEALGIPPGPNRGSRWRRVEVECGPTYGLETISAEMTAHGSDRPVTALKYELRAVDGETAPSPQRWVGPLTAALGTPREAAHHEISGRADHAGSVRFYATWPAGDQSVGLSLYGAPRAVDHGLAAGCLWLSWATEPAARPYLAEWRQRADALRLEAESHSGIVTYMLAEPLVPALGGTGAEGLGRDSLYALDAPQLLPTPEVIRKVLGKRGIGFWRSGDQRRWFASNFWDTIAFEIGAATEIDWHDVKPAKGGGHSEIAVDAWRARDLHGSRAIGDAVAALRSIAGVTVRRIESHDC